MNLCVGHKLRASLSEAIVAQAVLDVKTFICFIINDLQKPAGLGGPKASCFATVTRCNGNEASEASSSAKLAKLRLVLFGEKIFRDGPARWREFLVLWLGTLGTLVMG
jgi:hypothetical protein